MRKGFTRPGQRKTFRDIFERYQLARCPTLLLGNTMFRMRAEQRMYSDQETLVSPFYYFVFHVIDTFDEETSQQRNKNCHNLVP